LGGYATEEEDGARARGGGETPRSCRVDMRCGVVLLVGGQGLGGAPWLPWGLPALGGGGGCRGLKDWSTVPSGRTATVTAALTCPPPLSDSKEEDCDREGAGRAGSAAVRTPEGRVWATRS
jgi:hypothetical protein